MNNTFKPTWLYIKQHNITGLRYFGKTIRKDPIRYNGSGLYWKNHLKSYGVDITTIWCQLFTDKDALINYALEFSKTHNIVESKEWANLILENGLDGANDLVSDDTRAKMSAVRKGIPKSEETKLKMSVAATGRVKSVEHRNRISESLTGRVGSPQSEETRQKRSKTLTGRPVSEETKLKMSIAKKGRIPWNKGKTYSKKVK